MARKMRPALRSFKGNLARRNIRKIAAAIEHLENRTLLTSIVSNVVTGDWSAPSTWVGGVVPGGSDNATIVAGANVSVTDDRNVENLTTQAGSALAVTGSGILGILNYNSGDASTIAGTLEIDSGAAISVDGSISPLTISGNSTISGTFQGANTDNTGMMTLTGGGVYGGKLLNDGTITNTSGGIVLGGGGMITNAADGTFNLTNDSGPYPTTFPALEGGTFINEGILNKTGGTGIYNFPDYATDETFNGSIFENIGGTVNINSGTFLVKGNAYLDGGSINVAANSAFSINDPSTQLYNSTIGITGTVTGSGAGAIDFTNGLYQPDNPSGGAAGTLNFPSGLLTLGNIAIDSYNGFTLDNTGFMNFDSAAQTGGISLTNDGTIQNTGAGSIVFTNVTNDSTGLIDLKSDAGLIYGTVNIKQNLLNMGTLRKSAGTGTSNISALLTNTTTGTIDVESGTMNLDSATNVYYQGGSTNVATGATLDLDPSGGVVVGATWTSTGGGTINLTGGYIRGRNDTTGFEGASPGVIDFAPNTFIISGGEIEGSNEGLTNTGTITVTTAINFGSFNNSGTVLARGGSQYFFNGGITNLPGGVFEFDTAATIGQDGVFINQGTFLMAATGTIDLSSFDMADNIGTDGFQNSGTIEATSGVLIMPSDVFSAGADGKLDVQTGAAVEAISGGTIMLVASWDEPATTITTVDGTAIVGGPGTPLPALAPLATVNGTFEIQAGGSFTTAGALTNTGTLDVGGNLTVTGNLTESGSAATLNFAVSGNPGSSGAPVLTVNGNTTLAGNLTATEIGGYAAPSGSVFTVATFSSAATGTFASTSGVGPAFSFVGTATELQLYATGNSSGGGTGTADLAVTSVIGPTGGAPGSPITVTFTVTNEGTGTAVASSGWLDSVFLTQDGTIDNNSILLGRYSDAQTLAPGASYTQPIYTFLPLSPAGNYTIVVETDSGLKVPDSNRANNVGVSAPFTTSFPSLTLGQSTTDTINNGQDKIYLLNLPAGGDVSIAASFDVGTEADLYASYNAIPSTTQYDEFLPTTSLTSTQLLASTGAPGTLVIPAHQAGNYYILVHGREGANGNSTFTLTPTEIGFGAVSITPQGIVENAGQITTTIKGSGFTANTTVALVMNGTALAFPDVATQVQLIDSNTLSVNFRFDFPTPGTYDLQVTNGSMTATLPKAFDIGNGSNDGGNLTYNLVIPSLSRGDLNGTAYLEYSNTGYEDIPAPFFEVFGANTEFELADQTSFSDGAIEAFGAASTGIAGTLAPGQGGTIPITYRQITIVGHQNIDLQVVAVDTLPAFDLSSLKTDLQPINEPDDAWDAIWANFTTIAAANPNGLTGVLRDAANALTLRGIRTPDVATLMNYAIQSAGDFGAITQRYELTAFGRGQADPYAQVATTDANGNVTISAGGAERIFLKQANSTYLPSAGDTGTLSLAGGVYTLRETTGETTVFNTDGTLNYFQDINGNRLTAQYSSGQLTGLVASDGDTYTFTYNSFGRITQVTDPVGRVTTYSYDSTGQYLNSITTPAGTTSFTYFGGTDLADMYAITSITYPDGTSRDYNYDSQGRLMSQSLGSGAQVVNYTYSVSSLTGGVSGTVTATDALGNTTISTLANGQGVTSVTNGLSNIARIAYDVNGRPTSTTTPGGFASSITYNAAGTIASTTDALGNTTSFSYDSTLDNLLEITDPNGNQTHFTYDANGNLTGITDAAGNASTLSYDSSGDQIGATSAAGRTIAVTYNAVHLITSRTYADGSTITYTYDAHRNLLSAADSLNGTTTYTYDSADRLTSVTAPNGLSLTYTYNAAGQLIQKVDQTGFQTNYTYNSVGQLTQLSNSSGVALVTYTYDAAGNLTRTTNANGTFTTYTHDAAGEVTNITNNAPGGGIDSEFTYNYNANGEQSSVTTSAGTTYYGYDADGELTRVILPGGRTIVYAYDAAGNRTTVSDSAVSSVTYSTNNLDEYVTVGTTTYAYDLDGNLLSSTDPSGTTTYAYNDRGQMASEVTPTDTFAFQYDAFGNRVAVTDNGVTTRYLIDPTGIGSIAGSYDASGNVISHYVYGLGLAGAVAANGSDSFYAFDASGNTADITNSTGAISSSYTYLPFGQILSSTGATNLFTFAGQQGVQNTGDGLYFMRTRSYSPTLGRFIQKDPTSFAGGDVNLYRYAGNDPVDLVDPSGSIGVLATAADGLVFLAQNGYLPLTAAENLSAGLLGNVARSAATNVVQGFVSTLEANTATIFTEAGEITTDVASGFVSTLEANTGTIFTEAGELGAEFVTTTVPEAAAGAVTGVAAPFALAGAVILAPLGNEIADSYFRTHYPDGIPVPVQDVINSDAYQRTLKRPLIQDLIDDFVKLNGHQPDQDQLNQLIQYSNSVENGNAALYIQTHYSKQFPTQFINARDPNDIFGPTGYGTAGFVQADESFPYQITFENESTASAPAKVVTITEQLDSNLDWTSFQLTSLGFGSNVITVPAGLTAYQISVDISATLRVDISAALNVLTGLVTWTFTSIDPSTGDVPSDALAGFLPPDDAAGDGAGYVSYTIKPKAASPTGTPVHAEATITFDGNTPISTPNILNTLDAVSPTSTITALPATQSKTHFTVSWSGSDDANGSGIASYTIYVSTDNGAFLPWLTNTTATSAVFAGAPGHTYAFFSAATDNAGNLETTLPTAEATTTVPPIARTLTVTQGHSATFTDAGGQKVTITLTGPGTATLDFLSASGSADPIDLILTGTTAKSSLTIKDTSGLTLTAVSIAGSLATFNASKANLTGDFSITGTLGSLALANVSGATIEIVGTSLATSFKLGALTDVAITDGGPIKTFSALSWTNGSAVSDSLSATSVGALQVKGAFDANVTLSTLSSFKAGSITGGTWTLSSIAKLQATSISNATFSLSSLGALTLNGAIASSTIRTTGNVGKITVYGATNSTIFAGVNSSVASALPTAADFTSASSIASFSDKGKSAFSDTFIAASSIAAATLANVTTNNGGAPFGIATESLKSFSLLQPKQKPFHYTSKQPPSALSTLPGDLRVEILSA